LLESPAADTALVLHHARLVHELYMPFRWRFYSEPDLEPLFAELQDLVRDALTVEYARRDLHPHTMRVIPSWAATAVTAARAEFLAHRHVPDYDGVLLTPPKTQHVPRNPITCAWVLFTPEQWANAPFPHEVFVHKAGRWRTNTGDPDGKQWQRPHLRARLRRDSRDDASR